MLTQMPVQLVEHHTRFDPGPALGHVDFDDAVEIFRRVELNAGADRLPRLRRAAAPRGNRRPMLPGDLDRADDILARARDHDPDRLDLIDAGIRRVQRAGDGIETNFALDLLAQLALESLPRVAHRAAAASCCGRRTTEVGRPAAPKRFIT